MSKKARADQAKANGSGARAPAASSLKPNKSNGANGHDAPAEARLAAYAQAFPPTFASAAWPVHLNMWLEPRVLTPLPRCSGLRVERSHKIPARGYLGPVGPFLAQCAPLRIERPVIAGIQSRIPSSGLQPAGWEPRVLLAAAASPPKPQVPAKTETIGRTVGQ